MKLLLDTHLLLWQASMPEQLSVDALKLIEQPSNELFFSVASLWEASIKFALRRKDFGYEPRQLRNGLLSAGFHEVQITSEHVIRMSELKLLHPDPFDRLLVVQAATENLTLVTSDKVVAQYSRQIRLV